MKINQNTKVSDVLNASNMAIDVLISLSPKFNKLKNVILRRVMAPRVSIAQAAKVGGVAVEDILAALTPLGFEIENTKDNIIDTAVLSKNGFQKNVDYQSIVKFDVRPILEENKDPLKNILGLVKNLKQGECLCIINNFTPFPLIKILEKKGYTSHINTISTEEVHTYFVKTKTEVKTMDDLLVNYNNSENIEQLLAQYAGKLLEVDVREMEMPLPMHTIMKNLESLPKDMILYVHHKKIPLFLLAEIEENEFEYIINKVSDNEVKIIIKHIQ